MTHHLTYLQAIVTGLVQGVTELFPISSLGHNVLLPALLGGNWQSTLSVTAPNSPYLAFVVGLHVATAIAMIIFFWRDWLRIIRGFFTTLRTRQVNTPDERLAWMIILATIPVGLVGLVLQKEITKVFAKPELAAVFLAVNGVILLTSERMRRSRQQVAATAPAAAAAPAGGQAGQPGWPGGPGGPGMQGGPGGTGQPGGPGMQGRRPGPGPEGYSQQPWQQQWQGPDPRYGQDDNQQYQGNGAPGRGEYGRQPNGQQQYGQNYGQPPQGQHYGQPGPGQPQYGQDYGQPGQGQQYGQPGQGQYGQRPQGQQYGQQQYGQPTQGRQYGQQQYGQPGQGWQPGAAAPGGYDQRDPRAAGYQQPAGYQRAPGRHSHAAGQQAPGRGAVAGNGAADQGQVADRRLSTMGYKRAVIVGGAQVLALMPGISRDGIVTVTGMWRGLRREDAVRFSFLLSAPVILAAGALKAKDLVGSHSAGMHGPILVGSLISGVSAYVCVRFLTKYFSEDKSLNPFGIYCLIAGLASLAYLVVK